MEDHRARHPFARLRELPRFSVQLEGGVEHREKRLRASRTAGGSVAGARVIWRRASPWWCKIRAGATIYLRARASSGFRTMEEAAKGIEAVAAELRNSHSEAARAYARTTLTRRGSAPSFWNATTSGRPPAAGHRRTWIHAESRTPARQRTNMPAPFAKRGFCGGALPFLEGGAFAARSAAHGGERRNLRGAELHQRGYFTKTVIPRELELTGADHAAGRSGYSTYCEPVGSHSQMTEVLLEAGA